MSNDLTAEDLLKMAATICYRYRVKPNKDYVQSMVCKALAALPNYNPALGASKATYAWAVMRYKLFDILRIENSTTGKFVQTTIHDSEPIEDHAEELHLATYDPTPEFEIKEVLGQIWHLFKPRERTIEEPFKILRRRS